MTHINYKDLAEKAIDALSETFCGVFSDLYKRGEMGLNGKNYDDAEADWVDEQICISLSITPKQLDAIYHGEAESDTEYILRKASEWGNNNLDESSFTDEQSYQQAIGRLDGISDCLGAVMMLEHKDSTTHKPNEILHQCFDIEEEE